ncbi:MAG: adenylyltransferase/cytidyltransferase family protein [Candidatus Hodarchaeota archaeon]
MTSKGPTKVCAFGTFDVLHLGHLRYLEEAKRLGGPHSELIVVVARDSSVKEIKGHTPVFPEQHRVTLVAELKPVDRAVLGDEDPDKFIIIEKLKPHILAIGYDQWVDLNHLREELNDRGLKHIQIVRLAKFEDELGGSSTLIKKRIALLLNNWEEKSENERKK